MNEKHDLLTELAKINMQIMEGKNTFAALKEEEAAYLVAREEEAAKRVSSVLEASKDALETASSNLKTLESITKGISGVVTELIDFKNELNVSRETLKAEEKRIYAEIDNKRAELVELTRQSKAEQVKIDSAWSQLNTKEALLTKEAARVRDERIQLSVAIKHYGRSTT